MSNPSPADLLWQVHHAALEGRSSATGAPLPTTLDKGPPGAWMAHHAMVCFEALRRGEAMPARPAYLDDLRAGIAEDVARKAAAEHSPTDNAQEVWLVGAKNGKCSAYFNEAAARAHFSQTGHWLARVVEVADRDLATGSAELGPPRDPLPPPPPPSIGPPDDPEPPPPPPYAR